MNRTALIALIALTWSQMVGQAPPQEWTNWKNNMEEKFLNPETTIMNTEEHAEFKGLTFHPFNSDLVVRTRYKQVRNGRKFAMATSTAKAPLYQVTGLLIFRIGGKKHRLELYKNIDPDRKLGHDEHLFLPFTDLTCGTESYGGGRYLDLREPDMTKKFTLDFNYSYNPYCAYSAKYSCPIPPKQNDLRMEVRAGVSMVAH